MIHSVYQLGRTSSDKREDKIGIKGGGGAKERTQRVQSGMSSKWDSRVRKITLTRFEERQRELSHQRNEEGKRF